MPTQSLTLAQTQQLQMILAPQLRQSLEMLQLPVLELRAMVQREIEQNPTLEDRPIQVEKVEIEPGEGKPEEKQELDFDTEFAALAKLDEEWRDYFLRDAENRPYTTEDGERRQFLFDSLPQRESLQEHLLRQLGLAELSDADRSIGELIIGSISDDGYLTANLAELAASAGCDAQRLEDVLAVVQEFHPTGVGARDLRECLTIQLERLGKAESTAAAMVREHLDNLGARRYQDIAKALGVTVDEVQDAAQFIGTLDPKPGRVYSDDVATYILPEVVVRKVDERYVIVMDDDQLPRIRISKHYRELMADPGTSAEVKTYIRDRIRSGAFLIKSIHQRQKTIHRIASEIVAKQTEFLDEGIAKLRPLTMAEIAQVVGVHETTVSRAVSGKYMKTPSGIYEMKYFFTPGIRKDDGSQVSNKTVKDIIAGLVAKENPLKPLSDQELMERLRKQGIHIARRTIAKYRLMLNIPPSHMRRSY